MRPPSYGILQRFPKVDQLSVDAMMRYLEDPELERQKLFVDENGNTELHISLAEPNEVL